MKVAFIIELGKDGGIIIIIVCTLCLQKYNECHSVHIFIYVYFNKYKMPNQPAWDCDGL